jgi:hypothetical protein
MSIRSRLKRLQRLELVKKSAKAASQCKSCAPREITMHDEYTLHDGEELILPPLPPSPLCTCGRRKAGGETTITYITFAYPDVVTREEAEQHHRGHGDGNQDWRQHH